MTKLTCLTTLALLFINLTALGVYASDTRDLGSVNVLTEQRLSVPLAELSSLFTQQNMITVADTFGASENQEKRIEDGEAADLFITSNATLIQQLRIKGMVDIHSITRVASHGKDTHFMAAVVAGENMGSARAFLAFLKTDEAKAVFRKNGLSVP